MAMRIMWKPDSDLLAIWEYVQLRGVPVTLQQAILLKWSLSDNGTAAIRAMELLVGMVVGGELTVESDMTIEQAQRVSKLAALFLNGSDNELEHILGDVGLSASGAGSSDGPGWQVLPGVYKNDVPEFSFRETQPLGGGFTEPGSEVEAGDYSNASTSLED